MVLFSAYMKCKKGFDRKTRFLFEFADIGIGFLCKILVSRTSIHEIPIRQNHIVQMAGFFAEFSLIIAKPTEAANSFYSPKEEY